MKQPTQTQAFDLLYSLAAQDGREEKLFGSSIETAQPAFEKMRIGNGYPTVYLEFPLLGRPCFDMLAVYGTENVGPDDRFAPGAGFGYGDMFRWFSSLPEKSGCSCGIELDTGSGETERAGAYLQYRSSLEYAEPFLDSVGESARAHGFRDAVHRLPDGWPAAYVGLFPGREGSSISLSHLSTAVMAAQWITTSGLCCARNASNPAASVMSASGRSAITISQSANSF